VILNGILLLGVPSVWQSFVLGALILLAVSVDAVRRRLVGGEA
jgi:ribose/xylose/arabinose/galactoside ABC-type transport system permease subunit